MTLKLCRGGFHLRLTTSPEVYMQEMNEILAMYDSTGEHGYIFEVDMEFF